MVTSFKTIKFLLTYLWNLVYSKLQFMPLSSCLRPEVRMFFKGLGYEIPFCSVAYKLQSNLSTTVILGTEESGRCRGVVVMGR